MILETGPVAERLRVREIDDAELAQGKSLPGPVTGTPGRFHGGPCKAADSSQ